jgi:hypothetical protein
VELATIQDPAVDLETLGDNDPPHTIRLISHYGIIYIYCKTCNKERNAGENPTATEVVRIIKGWEHT